MNPQVLVSEEETRAYGAKLVKLWRAGDTVLLEGPLGAGKTTLVRGVLQALGHTEPVRSPTFNLIQTFDTNPPVMHADLYRISSALGIGLEEYIDTHLCLIEWPGRLHGLLDESKAWRVAIDFVNGGRTAKIAPPIWVA